VLYTECSLTTYVVGPPETSALFCLGQKIKSSKILFHPSRHSRQHQLRSRHLRSSLFSSLISIILQLFSSIYLFIYSRCPYPAGFGYPIFFPPQRKPNSWLSLRLRLRLQSYSQLGWRNTFQDRSLSMSIFICCLFFSSAAAATAMCCGDGKELGWHRPKNLLRTLTDRPANIGTKLFLRIMAWVTTC
jgi:hypothetical protein